MRKLRKILLLSVLAMVLLLNFISCVDVRQEQPEPLVDKRLWFCVVGG